MIVLQQLAYARHHRYLFNQVNESLNAGELLKIEGTNGSGKSTLLRICAGLLEPHTGEVYWQDQPISKQLNVYQQQLHYIGHENGIKPALTVMDNLKLYGALTATHYTALEIKNVTAQLELTSSLKTPAKYLSKGQCRRLSLAKLLLNPRPLWILDEPSTALDSIGQQLLAECITTHLKQNHCALVATHQPLSLSHPVKTIVLGGKAE